MRTIRLVARSVLVEAVRRREIYAVVLVSVLFIGAVMTVDFFGIRSLVKFYREVALRVMSSAAAVTAIVLAARQLPREFENRTIYPLLAKPVSRLQFLLGKLLGVMLATAFCFGIFMSIYLAGVAWLGGFGGEVEFPWLLFLQYLYLQMLAMLILATMGFWLSMVFNLDAAITIGLVFYAATGIVTTATSILYVPGETTAIEKVGFLLLTYGVPQLTLFDPSEKAVHAEGWYAITPLAILALTIYALAYAGAYFGLAALWFRRKPL